MVTCPLKLHPEKPSTHIDSSGEEEISDSKNTHDHDFPGELSSM